MKQRADSLDELERGELDVLVVGGGINGAVSAAALASHGARVGLIERGDFAGQTSMASSNLAWGGIKYMETLELGLVRKLCVSRNELLRAYPSAVRETRFLLTVARGSRWGRFGHAIAVYPKDTFKISLSLPSLRKACSSPPLSATMISRLPSPSRSALSTGVAFVPLFDVQPSAVKSVSSLPFCQSHLEIALRSSSSRSRSPSHQMAKFTVRGPAPIRSPLQLFNPSEPPHASAPG